MDEPVLELIGDREPGEDVALGEGHSYQGLETGALLHRGPFAGWGVPNVVRADEWIRPSRFVVIEGDEVLAVGYVERGPGVEPGVSFMVVVPQQDPEGVPQPARIIVV